MSASWKRVHFTAYSGGAHAALVDAPIPEFPSLLLTAAAQAGADAMFRTLGELHHAEAQLLAGWVELAATNNNGPCEVVVFPGPLFWEGLFDHPNDPAEA
jgi:hypothetical protein